MKQSKPCMVQKCLNEASAYLMPAGDVCAEHKATLPGKEWILEGSEQSATGYARPTILVDESLRALNEYVLLEPPDELTRDGSRQYGPPEDDFYSEYRIPFRVRRRGDDERSFTLVIRPEMMPALAAFFCRLSPGDVPPDD